jgi:pyruvate formate lyase activating enzyme
VRDWYEILDYRVDDQGCCPDCGTALAGRYEHFTRSFGHRRIPIRLRATA